MNIQKEIEEIQKEIQTQNEIINEDPDDFNLDQHTRLHQLIGYQNALKNIQTQIQNDTKLTEFIVNNIIGANTKTITQHTTETQQNITQ